MCLLSENSLPIAGIEDLGTGKPGNMDAAAHPHKPYGLVSDNGDDDA